MAFIGTTINASPTIAVVAGAEITAGAGKAVKLNENGQAVLCSAAGESAFGILIMQTPDAVKAGESVTVQIKDIGLAVAGGTIAAGACVTVDNAGQLTAAADGHYVLGQALEAATAGNFVHVQIAKGGKY